MPAPHLRDDPLLLRDARHSLAVATLAVLLTGGLLYLPFLLRVWRTAARAPAHDEEARCLLVFGKRLERGRPDRDYRRRLRRARRLARARPRPLILLGGGAPGQTEAEAGLRHLHELGLPDGSEVRLEDRSLGLDGRVCAAEPRFSLRQQRPTRLLQEAAYLCWLEVGVAWARLLGHRRMLARVS